jgi:hypothetical protein
MTGEWHAYINQDDGPIVNIVGFLPDGIGLEEPPPVCEIVVSSARDGRLLRDVLRNLETKPLT